MRFDEFAAARLPALLRYAVMLTGDPHLAEDIVQETMIRVQLRWRRVRAADHPELYVRRMLTNEYFGQRRKGWFRRTVLRGEVSPVGPVVPDPAHATTERDAVWEMLATLPPRQRASVVLRYYEGLADAQIAEVMGCAVGTVRGYISRALSNLRDVLRDPVSPDQSPTGRLVPATVRSHR